ncbi:MAG: hypothetical protein HQ559_12415 [Lentisphaerae bacterium]|nr:hypothetical protein [Lentisphaerota bacterium]
MKEADVIDLVRDHIFKQFPKECMCCGRRYVSFADFIRNTTYVGKPVSYDAEEENWQPVSPIGTVGMANCSCGSTLAISSSGMNVITLWRLMNWAKHEARRRGITAQELLADLRNKIDRTVLQDESNNSEK